LQNDDDDDDDDDYDDDNNNNNNNNNCKTSIAPKFSKEMELSGAPSTGVGQTHCPGIKSKFINKWSDGSNDQK